MHAYLSLFLRLGYLGKFVVTINLKKGYKVEEKRDIFSYGVLNLSELVQVRIKSCSYVCRAYSRTSKSLSVGC